MLHRLGNSRALGIQEPVLRLLVLSVDVVGSGAQPNTRRIRNLAGFTFLLLIGFLFRLVDLVAIMVGGVRIKAILRESPSKLFRI